jgi:hypothetical protein
MPIELGDNGAMVKQVEKGKNGRTRRNGVGGVGRTRIIKNES